MTRNVAPEDEFAGQQLKALRDAMKLTQDEAVADLPGIDRSLLSNLETGKRKITETYAHRLGGRYGVKDWRTLLPVRPELPAGTESPLDRLQAAEDEIADLRSMLTDARQANNALVARVTKVEQALRRRASA